LDILRIENLTKSYGKQQVLKGITFAVPAGSVFGFVGVNGAGKTTTMKLILGLLAPDCGEVYVGDEQVVFGSARTNRRIGYLPDVPEFYNYMRPKEYLKLCGEIAGMDAGRIKSRTNELLQLVGLTKSKKRIGAFSRGMKQRLGVAQALLSEPELLICDEPTSALDPVGRKEILDILQEIKGKTTVVFSTHILSDVERICDNVAVLHGGKIAYQGSLQELRARHGGNDTTVAFATSADKDRFMSLPEISTLYHISDQTETSITISKGNIENLFMEVIS
jgi:ABC-2 type transport system ATP-binding protein